MELVAFRVDPLTVAAEVVAVALVVVEAVESMMTVLESLAEVAVASFDPFDRDPLSSLELERRRTVDEDDRMWTEDSVLQVIVQRLNRVVHLSSPF